MSIMVFLLPFFLPTEQELLAVRMFLSSAAADRISSTPASASNFLTLSAAESLLSRSTHDSLPAGRARGPVGDTRTAPLAAKSSLSSREETNTAEGVRWGVGRVEDGLPASPSSVLESADVRLGAVGKGSSFPYGRKRTFNAKLSNT